MILDDIEQKQKIICNVFSAYKNCLEKCIFLNEIIVYLQIKIKKDNNLLEG